VTDNWSHNNSPPPGHEVGSGHTSRSSKLLGHLALALCRHVRQLQEEGLAVPREVEELSALLTFLVSVRHHPPTVADGFGTIHHARMSSRLLLTKSEAAERLGVSVRSIERLVASGQLPQVQLGGLARFRASDLEAFVSGLPRHSTPQADGELANDQGSRTSWPQSKTILRE
jgi:excisionase family DNA binding protein